MASIHFICRNRANLTLLKLPVYESGDWDVSPEDAEKLIGGMIYLHQTKAKPSYFGGRVESYRGKDTSNPRSRRIVFVLTAIQQGRGAKWPGASHPRAWTSGVVEDPEQEAGQDE